MLAARSSNRETQFDLRFITALTGLASRTGVKAYNGMPKCSSCLLSGGHARKRCPECRLSARVSLDMLMPGEIGQLLFA